MADDEKTEELSDELARKYDPERLLKLLAKKAGRGEALEHSVRSKYERRFGVDLGHVRVFTGEFAEEFNKQRNAYAVTVGRTGAILLGGSPDKAMGSEASALLAHELTHVAQAQRASKGAGGLHNRSYDGDMPFGAELAEIEEEAHEQEDLEKLEASGMSTMQAVNEGTARMMSQAALDKDIEKIKARVLEMAGDAARTQQWRNGNPRRA